VHFGLGLLAPTPVGGSELESETYRGRGAGTSSHSTATLPPLSRRVASKNKWTHICQTPNNTRIHSSYFSVFGKLHQLFQYILVFITMTDSLIPLASVAIYWRKQPFDLIAPVTMTAEKFEEIWPLVSCIYSHRKTEEVQGYPQG
jgi:hypothetical protein